MPWSKHLPLLPRRDLCVLYPLFQNSCENRPGLCPSEYGGQFPLVLSCGSCPLSGSVFTDVSSPVLKGASHGCLEFSLQTSLLSLSLHREWTCVPKFSEGQPGPAWPPALTPQPARSLQVESWSLTHLVYSLFKDHASVAPDVQWLETCYVIYFTSFFDYFSWKDKSGFCFLSWLEVEFLKMLFIHSIERLFYSSE